jgi:hypothetical protein
LSNTYDRCFSKTIDTNSDLTIAVYGRVYKSTNVNPYTAGSIAVQMNATTSATVNRAYTITATPAIAAAPVVSERLKDLVDQGVSLFLPMVVFRTLQI